VVQGRGGALPLGGHPVHQGRVDARQALEGGVLRRDVGHSVGRPLGLRLGDQGVVVEGVQEVAQRIRRGELSPQQATEPAVGLEHRDVVETVAARRQQQDERLDLRRLGVATLPCAALDVLGDRVVQAEGAHRLQHQGQAGPTGQPVRIRDPFHRVREEPLPHRGARRFGVRPPGCVPRRRARLTVVNSLMSRHARAYSASRGATAAARSSPR